MLFLGLLTCLVYFKAFNVFFAQDDFILINQFSQNGILKDIVNVFGPPEVTHWRPMHNLYFLITGNIFSTNFLGYHLISLVLHIISAFFVFKICLKILHKRGASFFCSLIYAISPVHFVSLFWISGNATSIAFLFFIISFYLFLEKRPIALVFYFLSLLASEAFFFGSLVFLAWNYIFQKKHNIMSMVSVIGAFVFIIVKLLFFTPPSTFDAYQIDTSFNIIWTIKYYLLRIFGFAEASGDLGASLILVLILIYVFYLLLKSFKEQRDIIIFCLVVTIDGLFPFILLKNHASANYMNLSLFGFSLLCAIAYLKLGHKTKLIMIAVLTFLFTYGVNLTYNNSWVIKRSLLAKAYIEKIKEDNVFDNSRILFAGDDLKMSEAYYALGGGEAFRFFFRGKNYKACFDVFENCSILP